MDLHLTTREALQELVEDLVHESPAVAVLFTAVGCHLSDDVEPRVSRLLREQFPLMRYTVVTLSDAPHLVARLGIAETPTLVVWFSGTETARFVREDSMDSLAEALEPRYLARFGN